MWRRARSAASTACSQAGGAAGGSQSQGPTRRTFCGQSQRGYSNGSPVRYSTSGAARNRSAARLSAGTPTRARSSLTRGRRIRSSEPNTIGPSAASRSRPARPRAGRNPGPNGGASRRHRERISNSTYATMAGVPPAAPVAFACSRRSGRCARRLSPSREGCRENRSTNRRVNWSWANSARHRAGLRFRWDEPVSSRQFRRLRPTVACTTDFYSFSRQPRVEAQARRLRHQAAQAQTEHRGTLDSSTRLALTRVSQPSLSVLRDPCPLTAPAPRAMLRSVLSRPRGVCRCGG